MRHFVVTTPTTLSAAAYWALRADFELERILAGKEGRKLEVMADDVDVVDSAGNVRVRRVVEVALPDDSIPGVLQRWIQPSHLRSVVTYEWSQTEWDRKSAARVQVVFPHFGQDCVKIEYSQFVGAPLVPSDVALAADAAVSIHTHCCVSIQPPQSIPKWVVECVERVAESNMKSSLSQHPRELERLARTMRPEVCGHGSGTGGGGGGDSGEMRVVELEARRASRLASDDDAFGLGRRPKKCFLDCVLCGLGRFVCGRVETIT